MRWTPYSSRHKRMTRRDFYNYINTHYETGLSPSAAYEAEQAKISEDLEE